MLIDRFLHFFHLKLVSLYNMVMLAVCDVAALKRLLIFKTFLQLTFFEGVCARESFVYAEIGVCLSLFLLLSLLLLGHLQKDHFFAF